MDPYKRKLVALLLLQFASFITLFYTSTVDIKASIHLNQNALFLVHQFMLKNERRGSQQRRIQSFNRAPSYADIDLVGSYNNIVFKQRFGMKKQNFTYVCQQVGPIIFKKDTNKRKAISMETKVAIAITRLASSASLYIVADSYRVGISTVH